MKPKNAIILAALATGLWSCSANTRSDDHLQISNALSGYMMAIDTVADANEERRVDHALEILRDHVTKDFTVSIPATETNCPSSKCPAQEDGASTFLRYIDSSFRNLGVMRAVHEVAVPHIQIYRDRATVVSAFTATHVIPEDKLYVWRGSYRDEFIKVNDRWLIESRTIDAAFDRIMAVETELRETADMPAYIIGFVKVTDTGPVSEYLSQVPGFHEKWGGKLLSVSRNPATMEGPGTDAQTVVLLEFPDYESAKGYYEDPGYVAAREIRRDAAEVNAILINGGGNIGGD